MVKSVTHAASLFTEAAEAVVVVCGASGFGCGGEGCLGLDIGGSASCMWVRGSIGRNSAPSLLCRTNQQQVLEMESFKWAFTYLNSSWLVAWRHYFISCTAPPTHHVPGVLLKDAAAGVSWHDFAYSSRRSLELRRLSRQSARCLEEERARERSERQFLCLGSRWRPISK